MRSIPSGHGKVYVPAEHFDRLATPVASMVVITTADALGRFNAAPVATCLRNNHEPTCFEFTMSSRTHTAQNILETGEFVVNTVPFDRDVLEKVQVTALPFPRGVNELDAAGLTHLPSQCVAPPRIAECLSHFECKVEWTKLWLETRLTIVGRVLAASVDEGCIDEAGYVIHRKMRVAQHCGAAYGARYIGPHELIEVATRWSGPDPKTWGLAEASFQMGAADKGA